MSVFTRVPSLQTLSPSGPLLYFEATRTDVLHRIVFIRFKTNRGTRVFLNARQLVHIDTTGIIGLCRILRIIHNEMCASSLTIGFEHARKPCTCSHQGSLDPSYIYAMDSNL
jgi:ABC-type transporter Mla MlaB component